MQSKKPHCYIYGLDTQSCQRWQVCHSPMKGKADGNMVNMPLLYMVNVTAKYIARLPNTKNVLTAVQ